MPALETAPLDALSVESLLGVLRAPRHPLGSSAHGSNEQNPAKLFKMHCEGTTPFLHELDFLRASAGLPRETRKSPNRITPEFLRQNFSRDRPTIIFEYSVGTAVIAREIAAMPPRERPFNLILRSPVFQERMFVQRNLTEKELLVQAATMVDDRYRLYQGGFVAYKGKHIITDRVPVAAVLRGGSPDPYFKSVTQALNVPEVTLADDPERTDFLVSRETLHTEFKKHGIPIPEGMLVPARDGKELLEYQRELTRDMKQFLYHSGIYQVAIKPAYGEKFVVMTDVGDLDEAKDSQSPALVEMLSKLQEEQEDNPRRLWWEMEKSSIWIENRITSWPVMINGKSHSWDFKVMFREGKLHEFTGRIGELGKPSTLSPLDRELSGHFLIGNLQRPARTGHKNSFDIRRDIERMGPELVKIFGPYDIQASIVMDQCDRLFVVNAKPVNLHGGLSKLVLKAMSPSERVDWARGQVEIIDQQMRAGSFKEKRGKVVGPFKFGVL